MRFPVYKNSALAMHQVDAEIVLMYKITGAKTGSWLPFAPQVLVGYDTGAPLAQADIDALLGSSNEFVAATAFGSTAMGTDALGIVLNCDGQVVYGDAGYARVEGVLGSTSVNLGPVQVQTSALPNTLAAPIRCQVSSAGNLALQIVATGLDAATAGLLVVRIGVKLK